MSSMQPVVYGESDHWKPARVHYMDMGYHF